MLTFPIYLYAQNIDNSQEVPQTIEIETKTNTKSSLKNQEHTTTKNQAPAEPSTPIPEITSNKHDIGANQDTEESRQDTTETDESWFSLTFAEFLLVLVTASIASFTYLLYRVNKNLIDLTNLQFAIVHRPKLIVRWIYLRENDATIEYEIANRGCELAEIIAIHGNVYFKIPKLEPYNEDTNVSDKKIYAGQNMKETKVLSEDGIGDIHMMIAFDEEDSPTDYSAEIYFIGYIVYKGPRIGIGHRTAFCRQFDRKMRRFIPMSDPDPDYEHAD